MVSTGHGFYHEGYVFKKLDYEQMTDQQRCCTDSSKIELYVQYVRPLDRYIPTLKSDILLQSPKSNITCGNRSM